jgi:hypothetical protein
MWSDNDIDNAFQRLNPPEPEPTPFPLDAWLRLETELDKAVIERAVRRRLWKFFAAEVVVVALLVLGWLMWPTAPPRMADNTSKQPAAIANAVAGQAKSRRHISANQLASAHTASPAVATLSPQETVVNTPTAGATVQSVTGVSTLKSAPHSAATIAATSSVKRTSAAPHFSVAAGTLSNRRRRNLAKSRLTYVGIAAIPQSRLTDARRSTSTRRRSGNGEATAVHVVARQGQGSISAITKTSDQHPAAGNSAAPTEAAAETAISEAAAPGPLRRTSQLPLLSQSTTLAAVSADRASKTRVSDASNSASTTNIAALPTIATKLLVGALPERPTPLSLVAEAPSNLPVPVRQPRFYVGLVAAPDLTTVKFVDVERPMLNIGVVLEYRLTNRLRVSTGLLRANKQYDARREDYDWSAYPRAATRSFTWVDGACTVLDVPLNLRYDAVVRPQARLFGAVGLSSFFMQRERYTYDYTEYNKPYVWERTYVNENRHLFSVLNLSLGYERRLNTHWSLQAEPYLKLPLAGVGAGKVQLTSGGVFFGAKYGF